MNTTRPLSRIARSGAAALTALTLSIALTACGSQDDEPDEPRETAPAASAGESLVVEDPWIRATEESKDATMTAAFMVLDNDGSEELTVTGASTEVAARVELHEMVMADGKMVMQEMESGVVLAPGKGQLLQPGGAHLMLMDLTGALAAGDEVELTLELSDGSQVEVTAPVKAFTEETEHYHAPGTGKHDH